MIFYWQRQQYVSNLSCPENFLEKIMANFIRVEKISGILQSIIVQLAITNGLGRKHSTVDNHHFRLFLKVRSPESLNP